jgi:hypothetical protein
MLGDKAADRHPKVDEGQPLIATVATRMSADSRLPEHERGVSASKLYQNDKE